MTPFKFELAGLNTVNLTIPTFIKPKKRFKNKTTFIKPYDIHFVLKVASSSNTEQTVFPCLLDTTTSEIIKWKVMIEKFLSFLDTREQNLSATFEMQNHTVTSYVNKFLKDDPGLAVSVINELKLFSGTNPDVLGPVEMKYIKALLSLVHCEGYCGIDAVSIYKPLF